MDTLRALRLKYDQMHEPQDGGGGATAGAEPGGGAAGAGAGGSGAGGAAGSNGAEGGEAGAMRGRTFVFSASGEPLGTAARRRRGEERGLDRDEEDYFSSDHDHDVSAG